MGTILASTHKYEVKFCYSWTTIIKIFDSGTLTCHLPVILVNAEFCVKALAVRSHVWLVSVVLYLHCTILLFDCFALKTHVFIYLLIYLYQPHSVHFYFSWRHHIKIMLVYNRKLKYKIWIEIYPFSFLSYLCSFGLQITRYYPRKYIHTALVTSHFHVLL